MIRILFATYDLHAGGVEKALVELLMELSKNGDLEITLLLLNPIGEFLENVPCNVKILKADIPEDILLETYETTKNAIAKSLKHFRFLSTIRIALDYVRHRKSSLQVILEDNYQRWNRRIPSLDENYDIAVDFQGMGSFITYYIAKFVQARRKVSWIHNDIMAVDGDVEWQKSLYDCYNTVYCVSKKAKTNVEKRMPFLKGKLDTFYNVIPVDKIIQMSNEYVEKLPGKFKVMSIGRLSYQKGYDVAFKAFSEIRKMGIAFDYYIIGHGEIKNELEKQVYELNLENVVHFLGFQANPYKYLKQADLYFQPSRFEGFCIALGEAKIFHLPILTTDFAGADEQIINDYNGMIIPFEKKMMISALKRLIESEDVREKYRNNLMKQSVNTNNDCQKLFDFSFEGKSNR